MFLRAALVVPLAAVLVRDAAAIRDIDDGHLDTELDAQASALSGRGKVMDDEKQEAFQVMARAVEAGATIEAQITCDQLGANLSRAVDQVDAALTELYAHEDLSSETQEKVVLASKVFLGLAAIADDDRHRCIVAALTWTGVQGKLQTLLATHLSNVLMGPEDGAAHRLETAYSRLVAWQHSATDVATVDLNRAVVFPDDVEGDSCPAPCGQCTRQHNSWRKGEEILKFKCLLQAGEVAPREPGLTCTPPRRRRSFWRPHRYGRKTWCTVEHWERTACQQVRAVAALECGAESIVRALYKLGNEGGRFSNDVDAEPWAIEGLYDTCVRDFSRYDGFVRDGRPQRIHLHDSERTTLGFGLVMSLGLANGLAALRDVAAPDTQNVSTMLLAPFLQGGHEVNEDLRLVYNGRGVATYRSRANHHIADGWFASPWLPEHWPTIVVHDLDPHSCRDLCTSTENCTGYELRFTGSNHSDENLLPGGACAIALFPSDTSASFNGGFNENITAHIRQMDTHNRMDAECSQLIRDVHKCRPAWKARAGNLALLLGGISDNIMHGGVWFVAGAVPTFVFNAGALAAIGWWISAPVLFTPAGWTYLGILTVGWGVFWERGMTCNAPWSVDWVCERYRYHSVVCDLSSPATKESWTDFLSRTYDLEHWEQDGRRSSIGG